MTQTSQASLSVLGAGAWGTVLAWLLANNGHDVRLWARRFEQAERINDGGENAEYMPGLKLPPNLRALSDLNEAVSGAAAVVVAVPSRSLREVLRRLPEVPAFISASKGLEIGSFKRLTEILAEYQPRATLAALSGPNLSSEIALGKPAAATLASHDARFAKAAQGWLSSEHFRVYTSPDLVGVEAAGALKNVIALAAGLSDGLGFGDNSKGALIARGLAELVRLGTYLGGETKTFYGLAGLGDLIATCASHESRNHRAGFRIARGETLADLEAENLTAEGIPTVKAVHDYAATRGLELPISEEVYRVIYQTKPPQEAIRDLMGREAKAE